MIKINVVVKDKSWLKFLKKPEYYLKQKISKIKDDRLFKKKNCYAFSLSLSNSKEIKALNKKFRKKNKPTDILSFPFFDKKNLKKNLKNKKLYLGDIAISYEEFLKKNRDDYKNGFIKIFIHGFLHLLNFDHKSNKEFKKMSLIENKLFQKIKG